MPSGGQVRVRTEKNTCAKCLKQKVARSIKSCVDCRRLYFRIKESERRNKDVELHRQKCREWRTQPGVRERLRQQHQEWVANNRERKREYDRQYRLRAREKIRKRMRCYTSKKNYGEMWESQRILVEIEKIIRSDPRFRVIPKVKWNQNRMRRYHEKKKQAV
jgi:hypothetical protein